jgi:hypothetical protein
MILQPRGPEGLQVHQIRVYYDPGSGEVLHIHRLVTPPGENLSQDRIDEEMSPMEQSLSDRLGAALAHLIVTEADIQKLAGPDVELVVNLATKRLVARREA